MKHEWRKHEKSIYLPKEKPELVQIPEYKYFTIDGKGNPNDELFSECIEVLYSLAYAIKMSYKSGLAPDDYFEYTVYPLEGIWDISDEGKKTFDGTIDKNELIFTLMIRQPEFVSNEFASEIVEMTKKKKPHKMLDKVKFTSIEDGKCVQMLHVGSYDDEPISFKRMEEFCVENGFTRISKVHKEIYLSDARKVSPEKLKTVLRFNVKE
jgi:hypothetical protein